MKNYTHSNTFKCKFSIIHIDSNCRANPKNEVRTRGAKDSILFQDWPFEHPELTGRLGKPGSASDTEYPFLPRCQERLGDRGLPSDVKATTGSPGNTK